MKRFQWLIVFLVVGLIMSGCSKAPDETHKQVTTAPFTGEDYEGKDLMRPVLVTINNDPQARPQTGLHEADIVYEFLVEGGMTRYAALFQSALPETIGPIRSARDAFIDVAEGIDAFYIAHGYSPTAKARLDAGKIDHINGMQHDGTLFERSVDRPAPHNSYMTGEHVKEAANLLGVSLQLGQLPPLSFHDGLKDVKIEEKATIISVENGSGPQFTSTYRYIEEAGIYEQAVNDVISVDAQSNEVMSVANVLVLEEPHQQLDRDGRQSIDLAAGGKGLLFQAGKVAEIEWANEKGVLVPVLAGETAKLMPGKTWIHIIQQNPGITLKVQFES